MFTAKQARAQNEKGQIKYQKELADHFLQIEIEIQNCCEDSTNLYYQVSGKFHNDLCSVLMEVGYEIERNESVYSNTQDFISIKW